MYTRNLLDLKRKSLALGLCGAYSKAWNAAVNKAELMDLALTCDGAAYIADGVTFGWGLSKQYIKSEFAEYINGGYTRRKDGYTSSMYVDIDGDITPNTTLVVVIGGKPKIRLSPNEVCIIFLCGDCNVEIYGGLDVNVEVYGDSKFNIMNGNVKTSVKAIKESQWLKSKDN